MPQELICSANGRKNALLFRGGRLYLLRPERTGDAVRDFDPSRQRRLVLPKCNALLQIGTRRPRQQPRIGVVIDVVLSDRHFNFILNCPVNNYALARPWSSPKLGERHACHDSAERKDRVGAIVRNLQANNKVGLVLLFDWHRPEVSLIRWQLCRFLECPGFHFRNYLHCSDDPSSPRRCHSRRCWTADCTASLQRSRWRKQALRHPLNAIDRRCVEVFGRAFCAVQKPIDRRRRYSASACELRRGDVCLFAYRAYPLAYRFRLCARQIVYQRSSSSP
jgi:hypothetical protein